MHSFFFWIDLASSVSSPGQALRMMRQLKRFKC